MPSVCSSLQLTILGNRRYPYLLITMTEEMLQPIIAAWAIFLWLRIFREEQIDMRQDLKQRGLHPADCSAQFASHIHQHNETDSQGMRFEVQPRGPLLAQTFIDCFAL